MCYKYLVFRRTDTKNIDAVALKGLGSPEFTFQDFSTWISDCKTI